jgi:benzoylformate decarboxylase
MSAIENVRGQLDPATNEQTQPSGKVTVREAVIALLREFRMTTIFGNPGSTELPMFRDFPDDFRYVLGLQESVVIGMADGYAQATRNAAMVNLHSAAGVGHAMGNIFTAYKNCTPLVVTAGQQARSMLPYDPFLNSTQATEFPKPYVKWSCEPARAEDVPAAIARAYYIAMQAPCGPTFVSIPVDDWDVQTEFVAPRKMSFTVRADSVALDAIGAALDQSRRPVLVAGAAVDRAGAWNEIVSLAERHNALVWAAPLSGRCSFPESHPLFAGFLPANREKIVECLTGHDVILSLGAPVFTYHTEGSGPHIPDDATLYLITDDKDVAAWAPVGTAVISSLLPALTDLLHRQPPPVRAAQQGRAKVPRVEGDGPITVAFLMQTLAELRPEDSIVVEEAPSSRPAMQKHLPFDRSDTFFTCSSGGLGHAMPAAVGVALSQPGKRVIGLIGDGSSMYAIQALYSAAQLKLPMTFIIVNNKRYAALQEFAPLFNLGHPPGTDLPDIDFTLLARGQGCTGASVQTAASLKDALRQALASSKPSLLEVIVA